MEKSDHIALTLSPSISASISGSDADINNGNNGGIGAGGGITRRSIRRSWNQLSRCQRNLIWATFITSAFFTLIFLQDFDPPKKLLKQDFNNVLAVVEGRQLALQKDSEHNLKSESTEHQENQQKRLKTLNSLLTAQAEEQQRIAESEAVGAQPDNNIDPENTLNEPKLAEEPHRQEPQAPHPQKQPIKQPAIEKRIEEHLSNINIQEFSLYQNNSIVEETPVAIGAPGPLKPNHIYNYYNNKIIDERSLIEAAIQVPDRMPIQDGVLTINEFIEKLEPKKIAQKQHFHGATNERQSAVVDAFRHSWAGYRKYAWGYDNLKPISQIGQNWFGLGLTIVDALDTIYIMGLEDEFVEARDWVEHHLTFDVNREVNLFEVTIRVLGGLLSAYHLSGDTVFLHKSIELGNRLLPCFLSPSGIPFSDVNLSAMSAHSPKWSPDSSTSEVTTIQLEFRDLSRSTGTKIYEHVVNAVNDKVHALDKQKGLVPIFINANTGTFRNYATVSVGARGDSYYEYLLKQWIQTGRKDDDYLILDYMRSVDGMLTELMRRTPKEQHVYIGELINGKDFKPKMDHLTCYLPGTLLLGHHFGMPDSHLLLAKDLLETCYQTYMKQPTQLAPEITYFAVADTEEQDLYVKPNDAHNLLRPEFIESLYYFYALTGNRTYQDMGWTIFQAFEKHTKVASGYTSIGNVKNIFNTRLRDMMESFWLGETLKYFYLLFSDNRKEIDLEKWVFNTEAHPLPIRSN